MFFARNLNLSHGAGAESFFQSLYYNAPMPSRVGAKLRSFWFLESRPTDTPAPWPELWIEFAVEMLITFYQFGAEQMNLPNNFWVGLACWTVGFAIAMRIFWILPWLSDWTRRAKGVAVLLVVVIVTLTANKAIANAYQRYEVSKSNSDTQPLPAPPHPQIVVRLVDGRLPIRIAPHDTIYVLRLNPTDKEFLFSQNNDSDSAQYWPDQPKPHNNPKIVWDKIYVCEITNNDTRSLASIHLDFSVTFHKLEHVASTVDRKNGQYNVTVPRPGPDHIIVAYSVNGESSAARDGEEVSHFSHPVELPVLSPGSVGKIYLVSTSDLITKFTFPTNVTALVSGYPFSLDADVVRPQVGVADTLPWFGLPPTGYAWPR